MGSKKLEAVINKKHGNEANSNNETQIICKHFLAGGEEIIRMVLAVRGRKGLQV